MSVLSTASRLEGNGKVSETLGSVVFSNTKMPYILKPTNNKSLLVPANFGESANMHKMMTNSIIMN